MPDTPTTAQQAGQWTLFGIAVLGFIYAIAKWVTTRLTKEALTPIETRVKTLEAKVETVETSLNRISQHVEDLPVIRGSSERGEQDIRELRKEVAEIGKQVANIAGALNRDGTLRALPKAD